MRRHAFQGVKMAYNAASEEGEEMASCSAEPCGYCGLAPCVGDRCPQWDHEDEDAPDVCIDCGRALSFAEESLCRECAAMGGPCAWCGDVIDGYGRLCDRCAWEADSRVED